MLLKIFKSLPKVSENFAMKVSAKFAKSFRKLCCEGFRKVCNWKFPVKVAAEGFPERLPWRFPESFLGKFSWRFSRKVAKWRLHLQKNSRDARTHACVHSTHERILNRPKLGEIKTNYHENFSTWSQGCRWAIPKKSSPNLNPNSGKIKSREEHSFSSKNTIRFESSCSSRFNQINS